MVLFFVMSLVAAYANRNIIFEQKTSANQYRSTQAFEAAEAGVEWALAMLNGGNIDDNCQPSAAGTSFRARYLSISTSTGVVSSRVWPDAVSGPNNYFILCALASSGWSCSCPPNNAAPSLSAPVTTGPAPAFRLLFLTSGSGPGYITLRSQGCTRLDTNCLATPPNASPGDAAATVTAVLALKGAVATPPVAALTAGTAATGVAGSVNVTSAAAMQLTNTEPLVNGFTIDAAGAVNTTNMTLASVPGSPTAGSVVAGDTRLPVSANQMFFTLFGMSRTAYREQPAAIRLTCPAQCAAKDLATLAAGNPGRVLWLTGNVDLGPDPVTANAVTIGTPATPVVMVINGNLTASAADTINGLVYVVPTAGTNFWTTGGSFAINGAVVSEGGVDGPGTPQITYSLATMNSLRLASGSFVRVPGGWIDN
jgi:hypothetical protein